MNSAFYLFTNGVALEFESCATIAEVLSSGIARGFVENPGRAVRIGGGDYVQLFKDVLFDVRYDKYWNDMAFGQLYSNVLFFSSLPFAAADDRVQSQFNSLVASLVFVVATFAVLVFFSARGAQGVAKSKGLLIASALTAAVGAVSSIPGIVDVVPTFASGACVGIGYSVLLISWLDTFPKAPFRCAYRGWSGICVFVRVEFDPLAFWRRRSRAHDGGVPSRFLRGVAFA